VTNAVFPVNSSPPATRTARSANGRLQEGAGRVSKPMGRLHEGGERGVLGWRKASGRLKENGAGGTEDSRRAIGRLQEVGCVYQTRLPQRIVRAECICQCDRGVRADGKLRWIYFQAKVKCVSTHGGMSKSSVSKDGVRNRCVSVELAGASLIREGENGNWTCVNIMTAMKAELVAVWVSEGGSGAWHVQSMDKGGTSSSYMPPQSTRHQEGGG